MLNRIGLLLYTKLFGQYVDTDAFGNAYYQTKHHQNIKRWVLYNGIYDPSKIPADWQAWLSFMQDSPPKRNQSDWAPNTTGTKFAQNKITSIENIPQTTLNYYDSWTPDK
jgi:NADH:ubiquinone oxidoreductase subunit